MSHSDLVFARPPPADPDHRDPRRGGSGPVVAQSTPDPLFKMPNMGEIMQTAFRLQAQPRRDRSMDSRSRQERPKLVNPYEA